MAEDEDTAGLEDAEEELILSQQQKLNSETLAQIERVGKTYIEWARARRWGATSPKTLMKYVRFLSTQRALAPTTVNSIFSELLSFLERAPYSQHYNKETDLAAIYDYINTKLKHHKKKQAFVLSEDQVVTYLKTAPNSTIHLRSKLIIIIGIFTLARGQELADLRWEDIIESERYTGFEVIIHRRKTSAARAEQHLLVPADAFGLDFKTLLLTYKQLSGVSTGPIWRTSNGDPLGRTTIAEAPRHAAQFIGLPASERYTGHGLRAAGAMALANNGGTSVEIMMFGNWTSESAARGYLRESSTSMAKAAALINGQSVIVPIVAPHSAAPAPSPTTSTPQAPAPPNPISYFTGCTFIDCPITVQQLSK